MPMLVCGPPLEKAGFEEQGHLKEMYCELQLTDLLNILKISRSHTKVLKMELILLTFFI